MPQVTHVLVDSTTEDAYYLGFDLLLVRAPFRRGEVQTAGSRVVEHDRDDARLAARHAAIKVALLTAWLGGDEAWRSTIDEAGSTAQERAGEAGLSAPPTLDGTEIREIDLARPS